MFKRTISLIVTLSFILTLAPVPPALALRPDSEGKGVGEVGEALKAAAAPLATGRASGSLGTSRSTAAQPATGIFRRAMAEAGDAHTFVQRLDNAQGRELVWFAEQAILEERQVLEAHMPNAEAQLQMAGAIVSLFNEDSKVQNEPVLDDSQKNFLKKFLSQAYHTVKQYGEISETQPHAAAPAGASGASAIPSDQQPRAVARGTGLRSERIRAEITLVDTRIKEWQDQIDRNVGLAHSGQPELHTMAVHAYSARERATTIVAEAERQIGLLRQSNERLDKDLQRALKAEQRVAILIDDYTSQRGAATRNLLLELGFKEVHPADNPQAAQSIREQLIDSGMEAGLIVIVDNTYITADILLVTFGREGLDNILALQGLGYLNRDEAKRKLDKWLDTQA